MTSAGTLLDSPLDLRHLTTHLVALSLSVSLVPLDSGAGPSLSLELSGGRGYLSGAATGDFELIADTTFLSVCYAAVRPPEVPQTLADGTDAAPYVPRPSHQLCAGVDQALGTHWLLGLLLTASPEARERLPLFPLTGTPTVLLESARASAGASLSVAYDSAGFDDVEYGADLQLTAVGHRLGRAVVIRAQRFETSEALLLLRPSIGLALVLSDLNELSARLSYSLYSADPVTTGRFTDDELERLERATTALLPLRDALTRVNLIEGRLSLADSLSGYASAPVWFDARLAYSRRLGSVVKGQVGYAYERYVQEEGFAHVLSTRWTFRLSESLRLWGGAALQLDQPRTASSLEPSGLLTVGGELVL